MFGLLGDQPYRAPQGDDYRNNAPVNPLRGMDNLTQEQWFAHGRKAYPPPPGVFMELPAGGSFMGKHTFGRAEEASAYHPSGELSCDRDRTSMSYPAHLERNKGYKWACTFRSGAEPDGEPSPLHTMQKATDPVNVKLFGGTALAIAYTSTLTPSSLPTLLSFQ